MKRHPILMLSLLALMIACGKSDKLPLKSETLSKLENNQLLLVDSIGHQLPIKVKVASWGGTLNALLALPDDYDSTETTKYPLILFFHGAGQTGSTEADLSKLITQGLPKVIAGGVKIEAVNPVDSNLYKFIVLSPQHFGWTPTPENIEYILADMKVKYRVDTNRIYITGLSAGGQGVIQSITYTQALTNKIAAIVPMSPSAPDNTHMSKFGLVAAADTDAWFFSGASDPGLYTGNAQKYNDSINKYNPGGSKITLYPGNHCCWHTYYSPTYREAGKNIYEWMLTHTRL